MLYGLSRNVNGQRRKLTVKVEGQSLTFLSGGFSLTLDDKEVAALRKILDHHKPAGEKDANRRN